MTITVTNTTTKLTSLLSASNLALAEANRAGAPMYKVTLYNADSVPTDIVYLTYGEAATTAQGVPIFAPASTTSAGDSYTIQTGDLSQINLIANVASVIVNVIITPLFI